MRMRTTLAAGALAIAAVLGSTGTALAHDRDDHHSGGETSACGSFAGAGGGHAAWGSGCMHSQWEGRYPGRGFHHRLNGF
ncbi:hypothetical protein GCM10010331_25100 [Streptomyces xanthochromogenes]|uniref:hypothetical protein n=1 Tax=Streptomyces TaxID=1883 RepID=UPI00141E6035|nr:MULTISPECIES: hypothetical protein [Streptomyces]GHB36659.1 hypothetical protein GCM10010331_25100 [Streptomyces xanthochromogenes]